MTERERWREIESAEIRMRIRDDMLCDRIVIMIVIVRGRGREREVITKPKKERQKSAESAPTRWIDMISSIVMS